MSFQDHEGEQLKLQIELYDLVRKRRVIGRSIMFEKTILRRVAHKISDVIFEQLTGIRGAFSTRIAYISETVDQQSDKSYQLLVADSDGYNPKAIFTSSKQLMSPSWSPDGKKLTYVSFENDRAEIFLQDVVSGERSIISNQPGINSAPAWSPSGDYLALTLSFSGSPDIYIMDMRSKKLRQLTTHYGIDTEPSWTPDGRYLLFTSNRSGSPQIYKVPALGGEPVRITFSGNYNAAAAVSPDGEYVAMVHNSGDGFRIALTDINGNQFRLVTDGVLDEAPSFAPNSSMIIYSTRHRKGIILSAVSVDGKVKQRLSLQKGKVREPAWSPFK
jgi:TolB protein